MKKIVLFILSLSFLSFCFTPILATEDVSITSFNLEMTVDQNGLITANQSIDTKFNIYGHGIYAFIPQEYNMTWNLEEGSVEKSYYFPVNVVYVHEDPYEIETDTYGNVVLKIGDADTLITGPQAYNYRYTLQMRDLDLNGRQFFYLNLVGSDWEMPMESVKFSITLPQAWPSDIQFFQGTYGRTTEADVSYTIVGNTLTGVLNTPLNRYEALTIYTPLPNDFFTFVPAKDYSLWALAVLGLMSLIIALVFLKFGKDDKPVETVEFNPIDGLSSAQSGFIYDGMVDTKDVISLIVEWAYKGYLSITEHENSKAFTLTLLKEIDASEIRAEKTLFHDLFLNRTEVSSSDLQKTFYVSMTNAKQDILRHFQGNASRHIYSNVSSFFKVLFAFLGLIPLGLVVTSQIYVNTYRMDYAFIAGALTFILGSGLSLLWIYMVKRWPSMKLASRGAAFTGLSLISVLFALLLTLVSLGLGLVWWKVGIALGLSALNVAFVSVMDRRTALGVSYLGKLQGLKNFIEVAEKDKLEQLVHEDPTYFYKILPYAYVLNVSDVWSKKFESIAIEQPSWYVGPVHLNTWIFMRSLNHTLNSMQTVMTSVPQKSGSGGFGSGGGGFSGGGFGGGGGGHW